MVFPSLFVSLPLLAILIVLFLLLYWRGFYGTGRLAGERHFQFLAGICLFCLALIVACFIGNDKATLWNQGTSAPILIAGELYRVDAKAGDLYIFTRTSTKKPFFYHASVAGAGPKTGSYFVVGPNNVWVEPGSPLLPQ